MGVPEIGGATAVFGKKHIVATCRRYWQFRPNEFVKYITAVLSCMDAWVWLLIPTVRVARECGISQCRRRP